MLEKLQRPTPTLTVPLLVKPAPPQAGNTPLHVACTFGHAAAAELLLAAGGKVHAANGAGRTLVHCAVAEARDRVLRTLLAAGVVPPSGALHLAARRGRAGCAAQLVVARGVDLGERDEVSSRSCPAPLYLKSARTTARQA